MTTKTAKLSPSMQHAAWMAYLAEQDQEFPFRAGPLDTLLAAPGGGYSAGTTSALLRRGFYERCGMGGNSEIALTDAGRAWIAGQIEAAHAEALWANLDRAQHLSPREATGCAVTDRAERMLLRAGEQVGIMLDFDLAEPDRIDALCEHLRRAKAWANVASQLGTADGALDALNVALALAARSGVVGCPVEIVERDEAEAWEIYAAALDAKHTRLLGRTDLLIGIAQRVGYSLDVLRKIASERVELGADGCGCPITEEITANGASVEDTERTEHRAGCWNAAPAKRSPHTARCDGLAREEAAAGNAHADAFGDPEGRRDIEADLRALHEQQRTESETCPGCNRGADVPVDESDYIDA